MVTSVFNTYESFSDSYSIVDTNNFLVTFTFVPRRIANIGSALLTESSEVIITESGVSLLLETSVATFPQVRFIDKSASGPLGTVPTVQGGDWLDVTADVSPLPILSRRVQYLTHNRPQTILIDARGAEFVTIYRNRSNPVIRTTAANRPPGLNL